MAVSPEGLLMNVLGNIIGTVTGISYGLWLVASNGPYPLTAPEVAPPQLERQLSDSTSELSYYKELVAVEPRQSVLMSADDGVPSETPRSYALSTTKSGYGTPSSVDVIFSRLWEG